MFCVIQRYVCLRPSCVPPPIFVEVFAYVLNLAYTFYVPYNADVRIVFPYKYVGWRPWNRDLSLYVGCCCCMEGPQRSLSINIHLQLAIMMKQTLIVAALVASASAFAPSRCVFFCCYESKTKIRVVHRWMIVFCPVFIFRDSN